MSREDARQRLPVPARPNWLKQVHGTVVLEERAGEGDAAVAHTRSVVCTVMAADCMPVLLADTAGTAVGVAHAGWRGLCAGVIEATVAKMAPAGELLAWLGPAIGPRVYEVGDEVRAAFLAKDAAAASAFVPTRPGHWLLDLYAVARQRLRNLGVTGVFGGGYCTYTEKEKFFSYRRDHGKERMAALIWLT